MGAFYPTYQKNGEVGQPGPDTVAVIKDHDAALEDQADYVDDTQCN